MSLFQINQGVVGGCLVMEDQSTNYVILGTVFCCFLFFTLLLKYSRNRLVNLILSVLVLFLFVCCGAAAPYLTILLGECPFASVGNDLYMMYSTNLAVGCLFGGTISFMFFPVFALDWCNDGEYK